MLDNTCLENHFVNKSNPEGLGKVSYRADVAPLDSPLSEGLGEVISFSTL